MAPAAVAPPLGEAFKAFRVPGPPVFSSTKVGRCSPLTTFCHVFMSSTQVRPASSTTVRSTDSLTGPPLRTAGRACSAWHSFSSSGRHCWTCRGGRGGEEKKRTGAVGACFGRERCPGRARSWPAAACGTHALAALFLFSTRHSSRAHLDAWQHNASCAGHLHRDVRVCQHLGDQDGFGRRRRGAPAAAGAAGARGRQRQAACRQAGARASLRGDPTVHNPTGQGGWHQRGCGRGFGQLPSLELCVMALQLYLWAVARAAGRNNLLWSE